MAHLGAATRGLSAASQSQAARTIAQAAGNTAAGAAIVSTAQKAKEVIQKTVDDLPVTITTSEDPAADKPERLTQAQIDAIAKDGVAQELDEASIAYKALSPSSSADASTSKDIIATRKSSRRPS